MLLSPLFLQYRYPATPSQKMRFKKTQILAKKNPKSCLRARKKKLLNYPRKMRDHKAGVVEVAALAQSSRKKLI